MRNSAKNATALTLLFADHMLTALTFTLSGIALTIIVGYFLSVPKYSGPISNHYNGKKFFNFYGIEPGGAAALLKWMLSRQKGKWRKLTNVSFGKKPSPKIQDGVRITFINHSTFLIQADGVNIITDPIWSKRASPFSWAGPARRRPPGIRFEDLPPIHVVLLSHNHYDHLSVTTMKMLYKKFAPRVFTSLGIKAFLKQKGIHEVVEMDWGDECQLSASLRLVAVPAQHFSGRGMFDRDNTLWSGFVIKRQQGNIYFAGDSGYHQSIFTGIGNSLIPIEVAILPIGAYKPQWFMSAVHTSPEEAVRIHLDVRAKKSIASHFGTFLLADEGEEETYSDLKNALEKYKVSADDFLVMKEGEGISL